MKTYPNYSSNPKNEDYGLFRKHQLLKYKPWQCTPDDAWDSLEQSDETYTGFSNLAGARRKSPATSSICAGYFLYSKSTQFCFTKLIVI